MIGLVAYLLLFVVVGVGFILVHLLAGKVVRPARPDSEKLAIYECGEPTIGSAWIQFDLRFYVVALLFVIFDVEVAFFFPWAVVFGHANALAKEGLSAPDSPRVEQAQRELLRPRRTEAHNEPVEPPRITEDTQAAAQRLAWFAFWDIAVFFGVLLVGFAYLWKRGDLDWVRSVAAERMAAPTPAPTSAPVPDQVPVLQGADRNGR
jgi:NADH-quinone oxidoreductase subunit A